MNKRERMELILKMQRVFRDIKDIEKITGETIQLPHRLYVMLLELTDLSARAQAGGMRHKNEN